MKLNYALLPLLILAWLIISAIAHTAYYITGFGLKSCDYLRSIMDDITRPKEKGGDHV